MSELIKATVKKDGRTIQVYQLKNNKPKEDFCDYANCATVYSKDELIIKSK